MPGKIVSRVAESSLVLPPHVLSILAAHMETWAGVDRVFIGRDGRPMRGDAVRQAFERARRKAGMPGFRFHDLRHTGQTLAASTGATTKDLMRRLGPRIPPLPRIAACTP
jgi:integrase